MKILVVDDNVEFAESIRDLLREQGHHVLVANDGASGVLLAESTPVEAVVLDLRLPDISGYDVARALRVHALDRDAVILLLTADPDLRFDAASAVGIDLVLRKPVLAAALSRLLAFVRGRKRRHLHALA